MRGARVYDGFHKRSLADARQGIAYQHVDNAAATVAGIDDDGVGGLFADLTDNARFVASFGELDGIESDVGDIRARRRQRTGLRWRCAAGRGRVVRRHPALHRAWGLLLRSIRRPGRNRALVR